LSRKPKRAKRAPRASKPKKLSIAKRFALSAEKRLTAERVARAERERDDAFARLHELQERRAIREEVPFGMGESPHERAQRIALRNHEWIAKGGKVREAYLSPLDSVFGPLELPLWQDAGIALTESKARQLAELFKLDRRDIYSIYFSP
jgi:hypothetical protein